MFGRLCVIYKCQNIFCVKKKSEIQPQQSILKKILQQKMQAQLSCLDVFMKHNIVLLLLSSVQYIENESQVFIQMPGSKR